MYRRIIGEKKKSIFLKLNNKIRQYPWIKFWKIKQPMILSSKFFVLNANTLQLE